MAKKSPMKFGDLQIGDKFVEYQHAVEIGDSALQVKITETLDEGEKCNCVIVSDGTLGFYEDDLFVIRIET